MSLELLWESTGHKAGEFPGWHARPFKGSHLGTVTLYGRFWNTDSTSHTFLDRGRKSKYPEATDTKTGRTWKFHTNQVGACMDSTSIKCVYKYPCIWMLEGVMFNLLSIRDCFADKGNCMKDNVCQIVWGPSDCPQAISWLLSQWYESICQTSLKSFWLIQLSSNIRILGLILLSCN